MRAKERIQMAKFALVGVLNTGVDFAVFVALVYGLSVASHWAQMVSFVCGVANSYWWNRKWTFRSRTQATIGEALRFFLLSGFAFLAATAILLVLEYSLGWRAILAKAASIVVSLAVNYAGNRYWVFRMAGREKRAG